MKKAVLVCGGSIFDHEYTKSIAEDGEYLIAVDSGADHILSMGLIPDLLIGDLDSVSDEAFQAYREVPVKSFPPEKDMTDTELAIREIVKLGYREIVFLGALGNRLDHTLANIFMLELVDQLGGVGVIEERWQSVRLLTERNPVYKMRLDEGMFISLIPVTETVSGVYARGVKYPLANATLQRTSSLGISNEAGESSEISIVSGKLLVVVCNEV